VGDVRGRGLLIGLELIREDQSRRPLARKVMEIIFQQALKRGLLTMGYFPRIRINPPLVITEAQAQTGAGILDEVFEYVRDHVDWRAAD
jgi:4-aminobutyrate aminotransferase-like enzyme